MLDAQQVPPVERQELLARYIVQSSHIRSSDNTIKPDAFIPHPHADLSLTRHRDATEPELWLIGAQVAAASGKTLYGRGDIVADVALQNGLQAVADPVDGNPNHAILIGWPTDKPAQKIIALSIAASAALVRTPKT